jgi:hypothetical protein
MGPVQGQCQIVRMLHDCQYAKDAIQRDDERWGRIIKPNLKHVGDNKDGKISEELTEISK